MPALSALLSWDLRLRLPKASSAPIPFVAQFGRQAERRQACGLAQRRHLDARRGQRGRHDPLLPQAMMTRSMPIAKPMPGRGRSAQLLDQPVVAPAAAHRRLGADALRPTPRTRSWCNSPARAPAGN